MPPFVDRRFIRKSGGNSAQSLRSRVRVNLRLEILETRCLMSALGTTSSNPAPSLAQPDETRPQSDYQVVAAPRADAGRGVVIDNSAVVQRPRDQRPAAGTTGSTGGNVSSPTGQSPAQVPYVVVPETNSPHADV